MPKQNDLFPLIVVVGTTGSGKSALALRLAQKYNGAIICADSRTVYRGMDIGTAKPTTYEREIIQHYCLDVVNPGERFTAADFKEHAVMALDDIYASDKLPILVGGTGLYIDAVIFDYQFRRPADLAARSILNELSVDELHAKLELQNIPLPTNSRNPRHLIRALETAGEQPAPNHLRPNTLILGLNPSADILKHRITARVEAMVDAGYIEEVKILLKKYGPDTEALQAPGYKAFREYVESRINLDEAIALFVQNDLQLAKRQRTWFRRNKSIHWLKTDDVLAESIDLVTTFLNK